MLPKSATNASTCSQKAQRTLQSAPNKLDERFKMLPKSSTNASNAPKKLDERFKMLPKSSTNASKCSQKARRTLQHAPKKLDERFKMLPKSSTDASKCSQKARSRDLRYRWAPFSRFKGSVCTFQGVFSPLRRKPANTPEIAIGIPRLQRGSWGIFMKQGARSNERLKKGASQWRGWEWLPKPSIHPQPSSVLHIIEEFH